MSVHANRNCSQPVGKMSCIEIVDNSSSFEVGLVIYKLHMFLIKISVGS